MFNRNKLIEILIALIFLISATTKTYDFDNSAYYFSEIIFGNYVLSKLLLILLIILELSITAWLFFNKFKNKYLYQAVIVLLAMFLVFNIYFLLEGHTNCGCYGTTIESSPYTSTIKNAISIICLYYAGLYKPNNHNPIKNAGNQN